MACAITSLPVPVSPCTKTAESTGATMLICSSTVRNFALDPIKSKVGIALLLAGSCISKNDSIVAAGLKADNYRFIYEVSTQVNGETRVVWVNYCALHCIGRVERMWHVPSGFAMRSTAGIVEHQ